MGRKRKLHFFDCGLKSLYVVTVNQRVLETIPQSNCPGQKAELIDISGFLHMGYLRVYRQLYRAYDATVFAVEKDLQEEDLPANLAHG